MYMMTIRLVPPQSSARLDDDTVKRLVEANIMADDRVEHVYARVGDGYCDVIMFLAAPNLCVAQINGTALSTRLLQGPMLGWAMVTAWYESAV